MPRLNTIQLILTYFITGLFMGQFLPFAGGIIAIIMIILGWKQIFSLPVR